MKLLFQRLTGFLLTLAIGMTASPSPGIAATQISPVRKVFTPSGSQRSAAAGGAVPRRVNIPFFPAEVDVSQSAIFWFGEVETGEPIPGRNYIDVRIAYSLEGLCWRATVIDYYLWYKEEATASDNLTNFDALAIYLDTQRDRAASPQTDDYYFLVGEHGDGPAQDTPEYRRQGRGTGGGWNPSWNGAWSDYGGWQWSDGGPNKNEGNIDFGWVGGGVIPWATLGLSGPPPEGTVWGFGVLQYDQDQSAHSPVQQEKWPETFAPNQPSTWGELHFGLSMYTPPPAASSGSTVIRAATDQDNTVEDAWMGGGGWCNSGHEGHTEENHGYDENLFVGSEIQPTHFPCFNKSYLRFALDSLPPGKVILSATLTLHHWGGANVSANTTSYVWLSSVTDPWDEMAIHWNNAPLAAENLSMTPIPPKTTPLVWPGDPYTWDVTRAVADAYAAGQPVSLAIYDSTTGRDSSKYLTGSEAGDWDVEGRPRLDIVWGDPLARVVKSVDQAAVARGSTVGYTIQLRGTGQPVSLSDSLPDGLSEPITQSATSGLLTYDASARQLTWSGTPGLGETVTIKYTVKVNASGPRMLRNTAVLTAPGSSPGSATALVCVDCSAQWLPIVQQ